MGRNRSVVNDATTLWGLRLHLLEGMRQAIKLAMQVHADRLTPCLARHIAGQGVRNRHACVVEQQIDTAKLGHHRGKHFGDVFFFRHIGGHWERIGFVLASGIDRGLQSISTTANQGHFPAVF